MNRRDFLKKAGVAVAASTALSPAVLAQSTPEVCHSSVRKPMICVTLDYYSQPNEDSIVKLYDYILAEIENWNEAGTSKTIEQTHLYKHLLFGAPKYMLIMWFKEAAGAATFVSSTPFEEIRSTLLDSGFKLDTNIFTYDRGDPEGYGGG